VPFRHDALSLALIRVASRQVASRRVAHNLAASSGRRHTKVKIAQAGRATSLANCGQELTTPTNPDETTQLL
jgi:hypothetical protein